LSNKNILRIGLSLFVALSLASCAPHQARRLPLKHSSEGIASWYGPGFHGRKTASGERYNQNSLTAAHKTLPFGSTIEVKNLDNGKSVVVRINDRGPFVRGRVIDLSRAAAGKIDMLGTGTARVHLSSLSASGDSSNDEEASAPVLPPETITRSKLKYASAKRSPAGRPVTRNGVEWVISQQPPQQDEEQPPQEEPSAAPETAPPPVDEERF